MAKLLESHVRKDPNFEVPAERHLGLVVFCLKVYLALTLHASYPYNSPKLHLVILLGEECQVRFNYCLCKDMVCIIKMYNR